MFSASCRVWVKVKTIKVSNVSLGAYEQDLKEFFSFSGDIEYVEMQSHDERSQIAFVTFKDPQGAETAVLLSPFQSMDAPLLVVYMKHGHLEHNTDTDTTALVII
ncbi:unnamed protein product [Vicia faba]|uniref:RRM domain-containing protein n=1 Tax=Vicia faba TaxID=3906 RepID=A0AAV1ARF1_VICFA|nr:unnamed protein product [Vicia faba]CAI8611042.1 unnamed protein product [Vicia faba]CAI8614901.1 unnamed protein product [Vicia faba]